ncbi:MAG: polysaccharide biosynthesis protein [bacterium P3]|nr:MAG: polysaccharide biosynthesis protein [bacterium P3]KWW42498.1 MAG: Uncharacterized protein F083_402 [bacterium F083]
MAKGKNLKQKAASGMVWTALQKYSSMFVTFIGGIILARLLTPYDYGCIGMLSIFIVLAESFIDGGFGSALIQKKNPTQEDYSTIFYWNLGMAALMYAILFFSAPAIAKFYDIPLLCDVLRVQGLILFIYAFNLVQRNQLRKNLNFKLLSIVTITTSIISLGVTIVMAYSGFGVWALVTSNLISAAIPSIVFWFFIKWRPIWTFSIQSFKEMFSFGMYMFLTHLVNRFAGKLTHLIIGKVFSPTVLGYYSKAGGVEYLASTSVSSVVSQVTYPVYAQIQDDKVAMGSMIKKFTGAVAYITFPMMFILILIAKPLFVLLYSDRWLQSVPYFQVLCLIGLSECLQSVNTQTIAAIGKSKTMFLWALIKRTTGLVIIIGGLHLWGMKGLLSGVVAYNWGSYFVNIGLVSKYIGYKWSQQLLDLLPIGVISVSIALITFLCGYFLELNIYLDGLFKAFIYIVLYIVCSIVFQPRSYKDAISVIPEKYLVWKKCKK